MLKVSCFWESCWLVQFKDELLHLDLVMKFIGALFDGYWWHLIYPPVSSKMANWKKIELNVGRVGKIIEFQCHVWWAEGLRIPWQPSHFLGPTVDDFDPFPALWHFGFGLVATDRCQNQAAVFSSWWFWNIFYFSIYWEFHHPNWLSYFSEG